MDIVVDKDNDIIAYIDHENQHITAAPGYKVISGGVIYGYGSTWNEEDINAEREGN